MRSLHNQVVKTRIYNYLVGLFLHIVNNNIVAWPLGGSLADIAGHYPVLSQWRERIERMEIYPRMRFAISLK